jgi:type IV secretion system protein VirD4
VGKALAIGAGTATLGVAAAASSLWETIFPKKPIHGESDFCTWREAKKGGIVFTIRPRPDAILLGKWEWGPFSWYVSLPGEEHVGLWVRTRGGKGVSFVIPNLLNWMGSVVAFSVKKDLADTTAGARAAMGDEVVVFAPGASDWRTHRWNLLGGVTRDRSPGAFDAAQRAMWSIIPKTKTGTPYWDNAGRRVATAVAVLLAETPGAECSVSAVADIIGRPDFDPYLRTMIERARAAGRPYPTKAVNAILEWLDNLQTDGGKGVKSTIITALGLWDNEVVGAATAANDFDLAEVRTKRMATFIAVEPTDTERMGPIVAAFFKHLIGANTKEILKKLPEPKHRVLLMMDEFTAPDEIPIMARAGAYLADFGLRVCYVAQSKQQLEAVYGPKLAQSIALNTGAEMIFGGSEWSLCEEFSKRGGQDTVKETTESKPKFSLWDFSKQSQSIAARNRKTMLPQEIHRLDPKYVLVHRNGLPLLKLRRIKWYEDKHFKCMGPDDLPPPEVPKLTVMVDRDDGGGSNLPQSTRDEPAEEYCA